MEAHQPLFSFCGDLTVTKQNLRDNFYPPPLPFALGYPHVHKYHSATETIISESTFYAQLYILKMYIWMAINQNLKGMALFPFCCQAYNSIYTKGPKAIQIQRQSFGRLWISLRGFAGTEGSDHPKVISRGKSFNFPTDRATEMATFFCIAFIIFSK